MNRIHVPPTNVNIKINWRVLNEKLHLFYFLTTLVNFSGFLLLLFICVCFQQNHWNHPAEYYRLSWPIAVSSTFFLYQHKKTNICIPTCFHSYKFKNESHFTMDRKTGTTFIFAPPESAVNSCHGREKSHTCMYGICKLFHIKICQSNF